MFSWNCWSLPDCSTHCEAVQTAGLPFGDWLLEDLLWSYWSLMLGWRFAAGPIIVATKPVKLGCDCYLFLWVAVTSDCLCFIASCYCGQVQLRPVHCSKLQRPNWQATITRLLFHWFESSRVWLEAATAHDSCWQSWSEFSKDCLCNRMWGFRSSNTHFLSARSLLNRVVWTSGFVIRSIA